VSYVRRVLVRNEKLRYATKLHWTVFVPGLLFLVPGAIVAFTLWKTGTKSPLLVLVAISLILVASVLLLEEWFQRWTTEIAVTSKRVIYKRGFIRRRTIEMNLDKVESVDVNQSVLGRLLGYGDIMIRGVGIGLEPLRHIDHPIRFRTHVTAG
jgi:uncharacterized membrane protein YdbT with pleckstrin-like domain